MSIYRIVHALCLINKIMHGIIQKGECHHKQCKIEVYSMFMVNKQSLDAEMQSYFDIQVSNKGVVSCFILCVHHTVRILRLFQQDAIALSDSETS